jgi:DNA-binding transcriptional regulator GbsR (MarR family)
MSDRRDHFEASTDLWEVFRTLVRERKQREFDPTIDVLRECLASPDLNREDPGAQRRIRETLQFMETLATWADEMVRLSPETLLKVMKLGARIQQLLRGDSTKRTAPQAKKVPNTEEQRKQRTGKKQVERG